MSNHTTNRSRWHVQRLHKVQQQHSAQQQQQQQQQKQQQYLEKYEDDDNDDDDDTLPGAYAISRNTLECRAAPRALSSSSFRDDVTTTVIPYNDPLSSMSYPTAATTTTTTMTNPEVAIVQLHSDNHEQTQQKIVSKRRFYIYLSVTIILIIVVIISITTMTMRNKLSTSDRKDICIFDRKTIAQCHSQFLEIPDCAKEMFLSLLEEKEKHCWEEN
jgi:hypothetical protein